ncbi:MAG: hypothetical protein Q7J32_15300, partial [Sphingomonadaceae bacterium]|nr:hypothetical protein [Sphingomonadaceae bacterium]
MTDGPAGGIPPEEGPARPGTEGPELRSAHSYGKLDKDGFIHRSWMKNQGFPDRVFDGRPVIGICQTFSEFNPCHSHLRDIAEA